MKAFFVLACLAVASADPLTYFGANPYLVNPLVNRYAVNPYVSQVVSPLAVNKDQYQQMLMKKQLAQQSVQLAAQNAGDFVGVAQARMAQSLTQNVEKEAAEGRPVPYFGAALVKREAEAEGDAYTIAQARAYFGIANPIPASMGVKYYAANPWNTPYAAVAGTPLINSYINAYANTHLIAKREAESDPAVLLRTRYASTLAGYPYGMRSILGYPYTSTVGTPLINSYINPLANTHIIAKREAESDPAVLLRTRYASTLAGYPYGMRSILGYPYASTVGTPLVNSYINPLANTHIIAKREAESDPAVILRSGLSPLSYGLRSSVLGYPYGVRSSVLGYPYGLRTPLVSGLY